MSALVFALRHAPAQRVDVGLLNPAALVGRSLAEIAALVLPVGKRRLRVDDLFALGGEDTSDIVFRGDCGKLERIGAGMKAGRVTVEGDAGPYVGQNMLGGMVTVSGSAGAFCATGMKGGRIEVAGDVGESAGGAVPGEMRGMAGGLLWVGGNAGDRLGDRMRRGQILVGGNAGDYCATRMIAGTIAVAGALGAYPAYGMKRGTLILNALPARMLPTLVDCGVHELGFLRLLYASWQGLPGPFGSVQSPADAAGLPGRNFCRVRRYMGDMAVGGRGELLVRA